jgi:hypothetical protein
MSTLKAKQAIEAMSPITREYLARTEAIVRQDWPFEQKQAVQAELTAMLTPEQREIVEREALKCAIDLQYSNPKQGNRAARRKSRRGAK